MECEIGARVGAIRSADRNQVRLFGYGVYDGDHPSPSFFGIPLDEGDPVLMNPRITLDNGWTVWGMECWWGPEADIIAMIGSREVIIVKTPAEKADIAAEKAAGVGETVDE